jgi:hypothetical protein
LDYPFETTHSNKNGSGLRRQRTEKGRKFVDGEVWKIVRREGVYMVVVVTECRTNFYFFIFSFLKVNHGF